MRARLIRPEQYSLLHHSIKRRLVSRPILPPSASFSLFVELTDGAGEAIRLGIGEGTVPACPFPLRKLLKDGFSAGKFPERVFADLAASVSVALLPVPNFFQGCPGRVRCFVSWNMRHTSFWMFFLFSESTALSSRKVQEGENSGEWKKPENRSRAPPNAFDATEK